MSEEDSALVAKLAQAITGLHLDAHIEAKAGMAGQQARAAIDVAISDLAKLGRVLSKGR